MTLVSGDPGSEIKDLKARVAALEEQVANLQGAQPSEAGPQQAVYLKTITKTEAKSEISELFETTQEPLYYSDIMERLGIDLELVVEICKELIEEGAIGVDGNSI